MPQIKPNCHLRHVETKTIFDPEKSSTVEKFYNRLEALSAE